MNPEKCVVITGVGTGIGFATTRALLRDGCRVWGTVRRGADAAKLSEEGAGRFHTLVMDVTKGDEIRAAAARVAEELPPGRRLDALINNAGVVVGGPLATIPLDDVRRQFEVNVFGPLAMIQAFLPMLERREGAAVGEGGGRVINISSASGKVAYPFFGPYGASKFALEGLSDSLRREAAVRGIRVVVIEPGAVKTEIWDKTESEDISAYEGTPEHAQLEIMRRVALKLGRSGVDADRVVAVILKALHARNPRPRYQIVANRLLFWTLPLLAPDRLVDAAFALLLKASR